MFRVKDELLKVPSIDKVLELLLEESTVDGLMTHPIMECTVVARGVNGSGLGRIRAISEPEPDKEFGFRIGFGSKSLLSYWVQVGFAF